MSRATSMSLTKMAGIISRAGFKSVGVGCAYMPQHDSSVVLTSTEPFMYDVIHKCNLKIHLVTYYHRLAEDHECAPAILADKKQHALNRMLCNAWLTGDHPEFIALAKKFHDEVYDENR